MSFLFFFNDTATTEIYTLPLHDALPILAHDFECRIMRSIDPFVVPGAEIPEAIHRGFALPARFDRRRESLHLEPRIDRKSTRLNSSHSQISYAVFCLKKKKIQSKYNN